MKYYRKNLRLPTYDYHQEGIYFTTFCTRNKSCVLGQILQGRFHPSSLGIITEKTIHKFSSYYEHIHINQHVIMPNHVHILIEFSNYQKNISLSHIVNAIKGTVTRTGKISVWQRGYYERVIRNAEELKRCQEYIQNNPLQWELDTEYVP